MDNFKTLSTYIINIEARFILSEFSAKNELNKLNFLIL